MPTATSSRLSLRHLRLVAAIADEGNLVGAARRLNLTQPAVTKALQEAEAITGTELFDRTNRGVAPTVHGEALIAHARLILTQLEHAHAELKDLKDGTGGRVAVGTLLSASAALLPKMIVQLRRDRPNLVISVTEGVEDVLSPLLRRGDLDFVLGRLPEPGARRGLQVERLFDDIGCLVCRPGHPLSRQNHLTFAQVVESPLILPAPGTTLRRQVERALRESELEPPRHAVQLVSLATTQTLIAEDDYVAIWPWTLASREQSVGRVVVLPVALTATAWPIGITTRENSRLSPAAMEAIRVVRAVATNAPALPVFS
jgi:DNA-binding transcriptional LysR family regulator